MYYEVVEDRLHPWHWRVEAINHDAEVEVAIFSGPAAQERAEEYAEWKMRPIRAVAVGRAG